MLSFIASRALNHFIEIGFIESKILNIFQINRLKIFLEMAGRLSFSLLFHLNIIKSVNQKTSLNF